MRIFFPALLFVSLLLTACLQDKSKIEIQKSEAWTDYMPVSPAKTHLLLHFKTAHEKDADIAISGIIIKQEGEQFSLKENEYSLIKSEEPDSVILEVKAAFPLRYKNTDSMDVEIGFNYKGEVVKFDVNDIKIEKVY